MKRSIVPHALLILAAVVTWLYSGITGQNYGIIYASQVPHSILGWEGTDHELEERTYEILETRDILFRIYKKENDISIRLLIVFSQDNRKAVHPPEVCYLGSGFEVSEKSRVRLGELEVIRLKAARQGRKELIFYCYKAANHYSSSYIRQQLNIVFQRAKNRRIPSAMLRVSADVEEFNEVSNPGMIEKKLADFLLEVKRILDEKGI